MNYPKYLGGAVLAGLLLLPATTFARDKDKNKNEGNLMLSDPVQVGSTVLEPGNYKVEWQGSGPNVNVDILQGGKTVATTPATIVGYTTGYDAVVTGPTADNPQKLTLQEIDFGKQKEGLRLTAGGQN
jgi:hypothetical protein